MKRRTFLQSGLAIGAVAMLSGCGFHLRGARQATLPFRKIYVGFPQNSDFGIELKRNIIASGTTEVVTDPKAAEAIIEILGESREKVILSLNSQGRVREYTLYYKMQFRVKNNQDKELLAPTEIVLKRSISFNESQVMAKEKEEEMLYRDMQTDLVQQLLRRLEAIKPL
jgi:LPS-assembly lipoprotein